MRSELRTKVHAQIDPAAWSGTGLSPVNRYLSIAIILSVTAAILETETSIKNAAPQLFDMLDVIFAVTFSAEYLSRIWAMGEREEYRGFLGRLKFMITPLALIDLIALIPFYVSYGSHDAFLLRIVRLLRIFALARLTRFSRAYLLLWSSVVERRFEILVSVSLSLVALVLSSSVIYLLEHQAQPEVFGSIPRALWWATATLTTVGYGDVYPITALGKVFAGVTAFAMIGLVAMPTGILAAAFSDAFQRNREDKENPTDAE